MHLRKWYLDCVADDGRAVILYSTHLTFRRLRFRYAAALSCSPGEEPRYVWRLRAGPEPELRDRALHWSCRALDITGDWRPRCPSIERSLLSTPAGRIDWHCLMPAADVTLSLPQAQPLAGRGYVERLDITLPPWQLPIDELRWGRFIGERASLVWIQWTGPAPRRDVFLDDAEARANPITDSGVYLLDGTTLTFDPPRTLRDGTLGATVLRHIPRLADVAPARILAARETKWLSRAQLQTPSRSADRGWAIHEAVRFGPVLE